METSDKEFTLKERAWQTVFKAQAALRRFVRDRIVWMEGNDLKILKGTPDYESVPGSSECPAKSRADVRYDLDSVDTVAIGPKITSSRILVGIVLGTLFIGDCAANCCVGRCIVLPVASNEDAPSDDNVIPSVDFEDEIELPV